MDVVSLCALRASGFEWQPRVGAYALTVICKATFELRPNECVLAPEQEDLAYTDTYWNDDTRRSVVVPSDRAPYKPRADVVLVGHAYAPGQQPTRSIMARVLVGEIDKSIELWCDRGVQTHAGQLFEGPRLAKMWLTWERAAGGPETSNPVGMRFDAMPDRYGMVTIPNLQPPGVHFGNWRDTFAPVGYGPIAPHWPSRTQKLYQHAASFALDGWEDRPLPDHFDYGYFNAAPPDQQITELRADERIVLENLHPKHERLVTNLPGIRPRAIADRATGEREEIALVADTLWIDTDRGICAVVWRGRINLRHPQEAGRVAFWIDGLPPVFETNSAPEHEFAMSPALENGGENLVAELITLTAEHDAGKGPPLPFARSAPTPPPLVGISGATPPAWLGPLADLPLHETETETIVTVTSEPAKDPLPFAHDVKALAGLGARPGDVAPPPMIGPLAVAEMPGETEANQEGAKTEDTGLARPAPEQSATSIDENPKTDEFPLERCAALTARIARSKPDKTLILNEEQLSAEQWAAIEKHWADAIRDETKRGKKTLLDRFDAAYVDQLEKERGPIEVRDYAKLKVAAERGTTDDVRDELGLPRGAVMRIERVWIQRFAEKPALGERVGEAIEEERQR